MSIAFMQIYLNTHEYTYGPISTIFGLAPFWIASTFVTLKIYTLKSLQSL